jgi:hypothetical protein
MQTNKVNKEDAHKLRLEGKSYQEISDALGCSLGWCKANLKGIKKKDISDEDYNMLVDKGRSYDCITKGEIINKVNVASNDNYKEYNKEALLTTNRVRRKLAKEGDVIVRQAWIHPARAKFSYDNMLMYINMLNDVLDEYVRSHLAECGFENEDNYNAALAFMVTNSQFGQRIHRNYSSGVFEAIQNAVDDIEERNGVEEPPELTSSCTFEFNETELPY